ncbi:DUF2256 domain-containing protein [Brevundimonas bullata]|uniref:DUF2256 domain-containing protein n=1 Tax=Brevundimonas bullata TaxID=13160 RepID=UPI00360741FE
MEADRPDPPRVPGVLKPERMAVPLAARKVSGMRRVQKKDLPSKTCPVCVRPFAWRKKWQRDWPNVIYCSARCASQRTTARNAGAPARPSSRPS